MKEIACRWLGQWDGYDQGRVSVGNIHMNVDVRYRLGTPWRVFRGIYLHVSLGRTTCA